jgi:hypothetical protein
MTMKKNSFPSLHREITPPRQCKERGCKTWLTSANEDHYCAEHGGWIMQRLTGGEAREAHAELLEELMVA